MGQLHAFLTKGHVGSVFQSVLQKWSANYLVFIEQYESIWQILSKHIPVR